MNRTIKCSENYSTELSYEKKNNNQKRTQKKLFVRTLASPPLHITIRPSHIRTSLLSLTAFLVRDLPICPPCVLPSVLERLLRVSRRRLLKSGLGPRASIKDEEEPHRRVGAALRLNESTSRPLHDAVSPGNMPAIPPGKRK